MSALKEHNIIIDNNKTEINKYKKEKSALKNIKKKMMNLKNFIRHIKI